MFVNQLGLLFELLHLFLVPLLLSLESLHHFCHDIPLVFEFIQLLFELGILLTQDLASHMQLDCLALLVCLLIAFWLL